MVLPVKVTRTKKHLVFELGDNSVSVEVKNGEVDGVQLQDYVTYLVMDHMQKKIAEKKRLEKFREDMRAARDEGDTDLGLAITIAEGGLDG